MKRARIWIMPKQSVFDPQGKAIQEAVARLGFRQIEDIRQGRFIELCLENGLDTLEKAQEFVERLCKTMLANTMIEDFGFEGVVWGLKEQVGVRHE